MAVVLQAAARNAACNAVVDLLDGGSIQFQTDAAVAVATLPLGTPAFGDAASGTATANAITSDTNAGVVATYSKTGTTVTVTSTGHGFSVSDLVTVAFTTGGVTGGEFQIASVTANTFTFEHPLSGTASGDALHTGRITQAVFRTSASATLFTVSVTATGGGGDIELSSTTTGAGDTVSMSSYTHTQPA